MRCVGVPQVVKPDTRKVSRVDDADPFVGDERRLHPASVRLTGDKPVIALPDAQL